MLHGELDSRFSPGAMKAHIGDPSWESLWVVIEKLCLALFNLLDFRIFLKFEMFFWTLGPFWSLRC
jgi:hypothetical protein